MDQRGPLRVSHPLNMVAPMRLSASRIATWMQCPLQAKFRYVDGLPSVQNAYATYGTCMHDALELYNRTRDLQAALERFNATWEEPALLDVVPEVWPKGINFGERLKKGLESIKAYHDQLKWENRTVLAVEHGFLVPFGKYELTGFVDCLEIMGNGQGHDLIRNVDYKALAIDTPILSEHGWQKIGQIAPGDRVFGSDGSPTEVLGVYPQGVTDAYRVTFNDGETVVCSGDHRWKVQDRTGERVVTVNDMLKEPIKRGNNYRFRIAAVEPIRFPEGAAPGDLPIHPYVLGVLLGDGCISQGKAKFDNPDPGVLSRVREHYTVEKSYAKSERNWVIRGREIKLAMSALGISGCRSWEKFVPDVYLRASEESRRQLLAGLMDTDGHCCPNSSCAVYVTASPRLRDAVVELARSLGGVPSFGAYASGYRDDEGTYIDCRTSHRVNVRMFTNPFLLERKAERWRPNRKSLRAARSIVDIQRVPDQETVCIRVAAEDSLFLIDGYLLTHNTNARQPYLSNLRLNIQFTVYDFASRQPEFWLGNGDDFPPIENAEWHIAQGVLDMPRSNIWYGLMQSKEFDAGERGDADYMRLYRVAQMIERALEHEVYVPNISGDSCTFCPYVEPCKLPIDPRRAA